MTEIRFHVPGIQTKLKDSTSQDGEEDEEDEEEISAAQVFHDAIKDKANVNEAAGEKILDFQDLLVLTPRGRYDMDMFMDYLRLRGKTYDYKILYSSIARLFVLPKDEKHELFIVSSSFLGRNILVTG